MIGENMGHWKDCDECYYSGCSCAIRAANIVAAVVAIVALVATFVIIILKRT
jgi:hypothetical protein